MRAQKRTRTILVAIKELRANSFLDKAAHVALACSAELVLFHDLANPIFVDALGPDAGTRRRLTQAHRAVLDRLDTLAAPWRARGLNVSIAAEWDFPPHEAIVRAAKKADADLIVVQARRRHRLPALLGYTDWSLLRDSPIPVLLVKTSEPYRRPRVLAAVDPGHAFSKPKDLDHEILREAERLAASFGTAPHVVHSYTPLPPVAMRGIAPLVIEELDREARRAARLLLARCLAETSILPSRWHVVTGDPVDAIVRTRREIGAAVVVMGAVSRRGVKRLFIGNTAERLLDELPCDLLVVKPAGFSARVARARRGANLVTVSAFAT
jgi:universal stress protein E